MLNKSISYRLSIYISIAVIGVFIAFIGIYFLFQQDLLKENIQNKAKGLSSNVTGIVRRHLLTTMEVTDYISSQIIFYEQNDHSDLLLKSMVYKYSYINGIHVNLDSTVTDVAHHYLYSFRENDSIRFLKQNEPFETCLTRNETYKDLVSHNERTWSEALMCSKTQHVVVNYYQPIYVRNKEGTNKKVGEVITELSLLGLNDSINKIDTGERGYAFILSNDGHYLTHPNADWILRKNVFDLINKSNTREYDELNQILNARETGTRVVYPEYLDFEKSWLYYTPIVDNEWTMVFIQPYRELYQPLLLPILRMLFFSVLGILVIFLLITYIANRQIQPLSRVTTQLKRFSSLTGETSEHTVNEIEQVSESLNYIQAWYKKYKMQTSEEEERSRRRKEDLLQAAEIQQSFIKTDFPAFPERDDIDIYTSYKPAKTVSGDILDFFLKDDDHLIFCIGDVSGKGIPAAFFMSVATTIIKKNATENKNRKAKTIVKNVNKELFTNNQHQFFLTLFLGVLNLKSGKLSYCNAAHTTSYQLKSNGSLKELKNSHGLPLGLYYGNAYNQDEVILKKGDALVLYTDGITELSDGNTYFGKERLEANLKTLKGSNPQEMVHKIENSLRLFAGPSTQNDDISMLILKYTP